MNTDGLTPRSNTIKSQIRYTGNFGQPDGFASVLEVTVHEDGEAQLTLNYRTDIGTRNDERMWSIRLTETQIDRLIKQLSHYHPTLWWVDKSTL